MNNDDPKEITAIKKAIKKVCPEKTEKFPVGDPFAMYLNIYHIIQDLKFQGLKVQHEEAQSQNKFKRLTNSSVEFEETPAKRMRKC